MSHKKSCVSNKNTKTIKKTHMQTSYVTDICKKK